MGKKRKFNRFIRWIKSDLPEDNKSVLLLGVTKLPSPPPPRARPHTLHLDHHLAAKSQTLDAQPRPKPRLLRAHSGDSLNELLTCHLTEINNKQKQDTVKTQEVKNTPKKVSFDTKEITNAVNRKRLGFCSDLPHEYYLNSGGKTNDRDQDIVMDKSVDSIGSCSLDVDASSTDFSDSSVGSSDCTLRSLGVPTPTQPQVPSFRIESSTIDAVEPKKPSYLNLACTVNGYSNITNYDSKLRENFRTPKSREVSPIRPQDYHANITQDPNQKFLSPGYVKPLMTSPNMAENKSQTILRSSSSTSYSFSSSSSTTMSSKKFISNMIYNDNDTVDRAGFMHHNGVQSKFNSFEQSKISHSNYTNVNGKTNGSFAETVHESYMNGQQNGQSKAKSFIQQRVERLYGPGALAQGFFIRSKSRLSESENGDLLNGSTSSNSSETHHIETIENNDVNNIKQSCSSPSLPVLRHLRPEFRAQLPILSPKKMNQENQVHTIQKSTTVPSSLTDATSANGDEKKLILNGSKPSTDLIENKENIEKQIKIPEEIPAAPQVILPEVAVNGNDVTVNGTPKQLKPVKTEVKDGHYFLKILKNETDRLIALAEITEADIEKQMTVLTDDVLGYLRSASGKARLLVTQKMQQFEGLCHKNINQVDGEPFPTTAEDLQGFWDMVMLQVTQVDELFAELDRIKANNWIIEEKPKPGASESASKAKKLVIVKKAVSAEAEAARKQREAARKKMLEDRRKAMRAKQAQQPKQSIEIFVPESS